MFFENISHSKLKLKKPRPRAISPLERVDAAASVPLVANMQSEHNIEEEYHKPTSGRLAVTVAKNGYLPHLFVANIVKAIAIKMLINHQNTFGKLLFIYR